MSTIHIRAVTPDDAAALLEIYAPYVTDTAISFEYEVPSEDEFRGRIAATLEKYPYLAAERDGEIIGYAYTHPFVGRAAYGWTAETSIYVRRGLTGTGAGRALYAALEAVSRAQNIYSLTACIGWCEREDGHLSRNSAEFHAHMGYSHAEVVRHGVDGKAACRAPGESAGGDTLSGAERAGAARMRS